MHIRQLYESERESRSLVSDSEQDRVIALLEELRGQLCSPIGYLLHRARIRRFAGLYLSGPTGCGKTMMMDMFCASLPESYVYRVHFHRFMLQVHQHLSAVVGTVNPLAKVAAEWAGRVRVLCLDEFLVADIGDAMILERLLRHMLGRGLVLVTTSNLLPQELYRDGLHRDRFLPAIDLLNRALRTVSLDSSHDYRMDMLTSAGVFLESPTEVGEPWLQEHFAMLAGACGSGQIEILGRALPVRAYAPGVVWFDFADLCGGPRVAADYLEISWEFHTLLLGAVPALDDMVLDQVRRLISLVDVLYDNGVKLLLHTNTSLDNLYRGQQLQQDFRRTRSRLDEMQTEAYLSRAHRW